MTRIIAKKITLKDNDGNCLIPYTIPYTAGTGIRIEDNVISLTGCEGLKYEELDEDNIIINISIKDEVVSDNIIYSVFNNNDLTEEVEDSVTDSLSYNGLDDNGEDMGAEDTTLTSFVYKLL